MKKLLTVVTIAILIVSPMLISCGGGETEPNADDAGNKHAYDGSEARANNETPTIESMTRDNMLTAGKGKSNSDKRFIPGKGAPTIESELNVHIIPRPGNPILIEDGKTFGILYGAGDVDSGEIIRRYIKKHNIPILNYIMIPSNTERTFAGAEAIIKSMPVKFIGLSGDQDTQGTKGSVLRAARDNKTLVKQQKAGGIWVENGVTFEILYPLNANDDSDAPMVIRFTKGGISFLLTSQIDADDEQKMLDRGKIQQTDIVIVTSGAPVGSMSEDFISALDPKEIIVCGLPNGVNREALPEFAKELDGRVSTVIKTDGKDYSIDSIAESDGADE